MGVLVYPGKIISTKLEMEATGIRKKPYTAALDSTTILYRNESFVGGMHKEVSWCGVGDQSAWHIILVY